MHDAGLEPNVVIEQARRYSVIRRDVCTDERLAVTRRWLAGPDRPEAVIGYSVAEAGVLLLAAAMQGLATPDDLALVAIADEVLPYLGSPMTTVVLPWNAIGRAAVDQLCSQFGSRSLGSDLVQITPVLQQGVTTRR